MTPPTLEALPSLVGNLENRRTDGGDHLDEQISDGYAYENGQWPMIWRDAIGWAGDEIYEGQAVRTRDHERTSRDGLRNGRAGYTTERKNSEFDGMTRGRKGQRGVYATNDPGKESDGHEETTKHTIRLQSRMCVSFQVGSCVFNQSSLITLHTSNSGFGQRP